MSARSLAFGVLTFQAMAYAELRSDAQFVEKIGLDAVWLADQAVPERLSILEAWTALSALAADTERVRIGTLITNVAMRNPMLLARQALTVDQISEGRLDVGIGAGYYEDDHRWLGIDYLDGAGRVQRLTEVTEVLDRAMRGERVTYTGAHVRLDDAPSLLPVQLPRPPIWIAVFGTKSLRLAARLADGAASVGEEGDLERTLPRFHERMKRLDEICVMLGRDPRSLRRCYLAGFAQEYVFSSSESVADLSAGLQRRAQLISYSALPIKPSQPSSPPLQAAISLLARSWRSSSPTCSRGSGADELLNAFSTHS